MAHRGDRRELALRCRCGHVRGRAIDVSPSTANRVVCYCRDCRAFALWLERGDVLDAGGGTEIVQMARARVVIDTGRDRLACMRLSDRGMYRWYTSCCRTPIGNTIPRLPFMGVIGAFFAADEAQLRVAATPPVAVSFVKGATGATRDAERSTPRMLAHVVRLLATWRLQRLFGDTFFDPRSRAPTTAPRVLSTDERAAIRDSA